MAKREPQNNLRYIKTEKLIRQTFREMLKEMDYHQISIKELTKRAMINRKTFYLHYNTLDELLGVLQTELYERFIQSVSDIILPNDLDKLIRELYTFNRNNTEIDEKILYSQGNFPTGESPGDNTIKAIYNHRHLDERFSKYNRYENNIITTYLNGCFFLIYSQWIADGKKIPLEDIIQLTTMLLSRGLENLPYELPRS